MAAHLNQCSMSSCDCWADRSISAQYRINFDLNYLSLLIISLMNSKMNRIIQIDSSLNSFYPFSQSSLFSSESSSFGTST